MGIKKKLGLGVASAALGISLVGGGTWAAFNDVKVNSATFAAGTLVLNTNDVTSTGVNLSNLKPGDIFEKEFRLSNGGSLAIKDVLLKLGYRNFSSTWGNNTSAEDFLDQFKISILSIGKNDKKNGLGNAVGAVEERTIVKDMSLLEFYQMTNDDTQDRRVSVVTHPGGDNAAYNGLPVDPENSGNLKFVIEFKNTDNKDGNGLQEQNKYQGNSITLDFNFEAIQWNGLTIKANHVDGNGHIFQNGKANSENNTEEEVDPGDDQGSIPVTVTKQEKNTWTWSKKDQSYTLQAQIKYKQSNGKIATSETKNVPNANPDGQEVTFRVRDSDNKWYDLTSTFYK